MSDPRWQSDLLATRNLVTKYASDPAKLVSEMQRVFGSRDRTASLALWQLGYTGA